MAQFTLNFIATFLQITTKEELVGSGWRDELLLVFGFFFPPSQLCTHTAVHPVLLRMCVVLNCATGNSLISNYIFKAINGAVMEY